MQDHEINIVKDIVSRHVKDATDLNLVYGILERLRKRNKVAQTQELARVAALVEEVTKKPAPKAAEKPAKKKATAKKPSKKKAKK